MTIDNSEKKVLVVTLTLIGLFVFSLLYAKRKYKTDLPDCLPYNKTYTIPKIEQLAPHTYQVFAVAQMWQFQPSEMYIPVGSEVDFFVTSRDVVHGFNIAQKNVNMMAVPGAINKTTVKFDKPGVYDIICHEYCGIGHQNMRARVIVNYPQAK
jgi:cytochrome c oxidase subunit 2